MWFGITLIVIGAVLLLQNLGIITAASWDIIWPVLVVLLGISILAKSVCWRGKTY
ncbi:MAG: DUF5668 domain-containing protein [Candidatus Omnitrophica bacterium]|nr:DUF5668 domain-containing protein [Candidatus Omnitrophota bacterium]